MVLSSPVTALPSIGDRFEQVRLDIAQAEAACGRASGSVTLTAVSKTQQFEAINAALATGQRVFGENRVQEAQARWLDRRADLVDLELRLIGPLQTNKAADAVALFDMIETLDREKLARAISDAAAKQGRDPRVLIQVNTGAEAQKAGVLADGADDLIRFARETCGLSVEGLMCIPPADEDPVVHFRLLANVASRNGLGVLSMGMSADYMSAIGQGATHVRIGSALFGERKPSHEPSTV